MKMKPYIISNNFNLTSTKLHQGTSTNKLNMEKGVKTTYNSKQRKQINFIHKLEVETLHTLTVTSKK